MLIEPRFRSAILTSAFAFIDVALCIICLCGHGERFEWQNFVGQLRVGYSIFDSTTDFLLLSALRIAFLASATCVICAGVRRSARVLKFMSYASSSLAILCCAYSPTKLLALSEHRTRLFYGDWLGECASIDDRKAAVFLLFDIFCLQVAKIEQKYFRSKNIDDHF